MMSLHKIIAKHKISQWLLLLSFVIMVAASGCNAFDTGEPKATDQFDLPRNMRLFFTQPGISPETGQDTKIAEKIAGLIKSARKKVDICIYELSHATIYDALVEVYKRGIPVRFVGDIENTHYSGYQALMDANVPMTLGHYVDGVTDKIMHNKFVVVDDYYVTMGSANYTGSGMGMNNENVLILQSSNMAAYYTKEFENMYNNGTFGKDKVAFAGFKNNIFYLNQGQTDETRIEVYFTPYLNSHDNYANTDQRIMECISNAKHSIYVAMFAFTHPDIAQSIVYMATNKGIQVYLAMDKGWHSASPWSMHQIFVDAGLNIRYDGNENYHPENPYHGSKIHNKYMVVDAGYDYALVVTGSFNFSSAAATDGNDENCIIISNKQVANLYAKNFSYMYNVGSSPTRSLGGDKAFYHNVMINEINWPGSLPNSGSINYSDKFVELKNMTSKTINISGWQLVGTPKSSYRIISSILPKGSYIEPGGHYVIYYSLLNSAFTYQPANRHYQDPYLYLHSGSQEKIFLTLKDTHQNIIDQAGDPEKLKVASAYGGLQSTTTCVSMYRVGTDGTAESSWTNTTAANSYVKSDYSSKTLATPGTD